MNNKDFGTFYKRCLDTLAKKKILVNVIAAAVCLNELVLVFGLVA